MRSFYKLLVSDFKQFFRDKTALFFTFAFPIFFIFIFGWVFSGADDVSYDIGLVTRITQPQAKASPLLYRRYPSL
jgi:ABC-2 type transport system permease protein